MDKTKLNYSLKLLIMAFISFLCIPLGNLSKLGNPLYKKVYYGTLNNLFNYIVASIIWIICTIVIVKICKKKMNFNPLIEKKEKEYLPIKNMIILSLLTIIPILLVSGLIGWNFKPIYDLGTHFTGMELGHHLVYLLSCVFKLLLVYMIIRISNEALVNIFPSFSYIPFGALFTLLTFGLYELIIGLHYLPIVYLLLIFAMFYIYLYSNKTFSKGFILMVLIYLI